MLTISCKLVLRHSVLRSVEPAILHDVLSTSWTIPSRVPLEWVLAQCSARNEDYCSIRRTCLLLMLRMRFLKEGNL